MSLSLFHPLVSKWFHERFGKPHEVQRKGWASIFNQNHTLISAPTGSGKTLAAFLVCLDQLVRKGISGELSDQTEIVYISPLKALSNDIQRNLEMPLREIMDLAFKEGVLLPEIRVQVRTGDTPPSQRRTMIRKHPHILVTTPESFFLMLTSISGRNMLRSARTLIVDEIHSLARDKRGSHLALSVERLEDLCKQPLLRIGLSATQKPLEEIARFLVGSVRINQEGNPDCIIIDSGHSRPMDLSIETPLTSLSAVCSNEQWNEVYTRIAELVRKQRSVLIFVNTRRLAEKMTFNLTGLLGEEGVASHHGSLSKQNRLKIESRLKEGKIKAVVATASLELGIDIGFIDLVIQIGSPRSIATFFQRIGRSGHSLGVVPKGRLFALTRDELIESAALIRAVRRGRLDQIEIPKAPLDILAQQIVASAASEEWEEEKLFSLVQRAYPYRHLTRGEFNGILHLLSEGISPYVKAGVYLYRDQVHHRIKGKRGARLAALTSGGAIPDLADFKVVSEPEKIVVGTVDEDFALESMAGDIFLLGNTSWRIIQVRGGEVAVSDAHGAAPTIPFWRGEAPFRTRELSEEVSLLREKLEEMLIDPQKGADWLVGQCAVSPAQAGEIIQYIRAQKEAVGMIPSQNHLLIERFFDESGGMQLVIHAPFGGKINRAFGLALRKRFCRTFDFELQASADDNAILLSVGPRQSFSIEEVRSMIPADSARDLLIQALLAAPVFTVRWRWNVTRSLAVLRFKGGKKVPPALQRFRADDLLSAIFPALTACPENGNFPGNIPLPDHPLIRQTLDDALHEAMDLEGWLLLLKKMERDEIRMTSMDTREPSPFSYQILNGNPYTFLDGAPLEERRARAVASRRTLSPEQLKDLGKLDPEAIIQVQREAWPLVRDPDELHETLLFLGVLPEKEGVEWIKLFQFLVESGRATRFVNSEGRIFWTSIERWTEVVAAYSDVQMDPVIPIPSSLAGSWRSDDAVTRLVKGRMEITGPTTSKKLSAVLGLPIQDIESALFNLEKEGMILRGSFNPNRFEAGETEWCHRILLERIHRLTLESLRRRISPVDSELFISFLLKWGHLASGTRLEGPAGVLAIVRQLQGYELPAKIWENEILPGRMVRYDPQWLDHLCYSGEMIWGRTEVKASREATKILPLTLMEYEGIDWICSHEEGKDIDLDSNARNILDLLRIKGALFFRELVRETGLLPSQVEVALWKLVASGWVTGDGFEGIRYLTMAPGKRKTLERIQSRGYLRNPRSRLGNGRWSILKKSQEVHSLNANGDNSRFEKWCRQLLSRYGIIFRDLLAKENASPPWRQLLPVFRTMELKGEIRGGRFVAGVSGEQYGLPEAVDLLRNEMKEDKKEELTLLNASDPLNLIGIITAGPRLKAVPWNALVLLGGKQIGNRQGRTVWIDPSLKPDLAQKVENILKTGRIHA